MSADFIQSLRNIQEYIRNVERAEELTILNKDFIPEVAKKAFAAAKARQRQKNGWHHTYEAPTMD